MTARTEKMKMLAGELYVAADEELVRERKRAKALCRRYNGGEASPGSRLLEELLGYATDAYLEPPFFCDYGYDIHLGSRVYANHHLVILDCAAVRVGDDVAIGPNVVLSTAGHRSGEPHFGTRVREADHDRQWCLDRSGCDHPAGSRDRCRHDDRRRKRRDPEHPWKLRRGGEPL